MVKLHIPQNILDEMIVQAKCAAPIEACGILSGNRTSVESFHPMTKADNSSDHFIMEPREQFDVIKRIRSMGQQMLAIYHSHPASPARPSQEDIRLALTPSVVHVILSLEREGMPVVKGFLIENGNVEEVEVLVGSQEERLMLRLPESVRQDMVEYRTHVEAFIRGETSPVAFRAYRVPMGIYEQRTSGRYMVRVRIAAGIALHEHLRAIARLSHQSGNGVLHVTTRQDIQIHEVALEDTPTVLEGLLEVGLSSRGGGGNTVRNISASPANTCPEELFDVTPYAVALAEYLLQHKNSFNLPRKYKIAFSGCDDDCGQASIADLGFFAKIKDGQRGFTVFAGGGMGRHSRPGIKLEDFVNPGELFEIAEAVKRLFDRYGDRANKHKARLRFVLTRLGEEEFTRVYRQERDTLAKEGLPGLIPAFRTTTLAEARALPEHPDIPLRNTLPRGVLPGNAPGLYNMRISLPLGDIAANDAIQVADLAEEYGNGHVYTTQMQDLILSGVPGKSSALLLEKLRALGLLEKVTHPKIIACTGAATCKLGLCLSRNLATGITAVFEQHGVEFIEAAPIIRISGCSNSCGGHQIGTIGLEGGTRRIQGRLMAVYSVFLNGRLSSEGAVLAEKVATVPVKRIPDLLLEAFAEGRLDVRKLAELALTFAELPANIPEEYYYDFGVTEPFSLAGRGPGECGAGVLDVVRIDIEEAKDAIKAAVHEGDPALYRALVAAARSLLVIFGIEAGKDRQVFSAFEQYLVRPGWVRQSAARLINDALDWRLGDRDSLAGYAQEIGDLVSRIEALFRSLDGDLEFNVAPVEEIDEARPCQTAHTIDLCGVACPMNFVKAKVALGKIPVGDVLEIILDDGEPIRNVPASFVDQGQDVLSVEPIHDAGKNRVHIRRKK